MFDQSTFDQLLEELLEELPDQVRPPCEHVPVCPPADAVDRDAAHVIARHPEQGWSLLCNGVILFEDCGEILPHGDALCPRRAELTAAALHRHAV